MRNPAISLFALYLCLMMSSLALGIDKDSVKINKQNRKLEKTETSPLDDIIVEHYEAKRDDGEYERQIWLVDKKNPKNRFLLFEHSRSAEVLFSPNQSWLVINNFYVSNSSDVILYRKSDGLKYLEVKDIGIVEKNWSLCMKENKIKDSFAVGHLYAQALRWSADSGTIMVKMWGDGEDNDDNRYYHLEAWLCVFDIIKKEASMDLRLMNKNIFQSIK